MAYDGELVKMENGGWARFQRCEIVNAGHPDHDDIVILVAVELDEHYQDLLTAAEASLSGYRRSGIPVRIQLDAGGRGKITLSVEKAGATVH